MRLVITGATGNVGSALLRLLRDRTDRPAETVAIARRPPEPVPPYDQAHWVTCDLTAADSGQRLIEVMRGAHAVVHLAWDIIGAHRRGSQWHTNVPGTGHVLSAAVAAGVPHLVHLSSAAAYRPEPTRRYRVGEDWPIGGVPGSAYSADKVAVERIFDRLAGAQPGLRVARIRPPAILQPASGSEFARYLLGPLAPLLKYPWLRPRLLPIPELTAQFVHTADLVDLIWRILRTGAGGAFNAAAEPTLRSHEIATALGARRIPLPVLLARLGMDATAALRVQPLDSSWLELVRTVPLISSRRARQELGWHPVHHPYQALAATRAAMQAGTGTTSPRLAPQS